LKIVQIIRVESLELGAEVGECCEACFYAHRFRKTNPEPMLSGGLQGVAAERFAGNHADECRAATVLCAFGEHAFIGL
jgi:hypothetical protein